MPMLKQILTDYYKTQRDNFESYLKQVHQDENVETIHQMRLSIKRMRSLFSYLWHLHPEKKYGKKSLKELKELFKLTGVIRDIQVHLELVHSYEKRFAISFDEYIAFFKKLENEKTHQLLKMARSFSTEPLVKLEKTTKIIVEKCKENTLQEDAIKLLDNKFEIIRHLNEIPANKEKNLHKIRRYLKEARYLLSIFNGYIPESRNIKISLSRLKQIEQTLGKWHDQVNALVFINVYEKGHFANNKTDKAKYKMLKEAVTRYKEMLLKRTKLAFKYELDIGSN